MSISVSKIYIFDVYHGKMIYSTNVIVPGNGFQIMDDCDTIKNGISIQKKQQIKYAFDDI